MLSTLIIVAILICCSALFSATETAVFSVGLIRLRTLANAGNKTAKLLEKMRLNPKLPLGAILIGNNLVNIGASAIVTVTMTRRFNDAVVGIATGVLTLLVIIFGEILPKTFAAHNNERLALIMARPLHYLTVLLSPILAAINAVTDRLIGHRAGPIAPSVSEEEIRAMASLGVSAGTLAKGEKDLIDRVFLMNDITADDVMTPRESIIALDGRKTLGEALPLIESSEFSRYPVFDDGDKDKIIGILHIKDIFRRLATPSEVDPRGLPIRDLAETLPFVPKTKPIDQLMREMQKQHVHMAMVVNERGSISGLVTLEDLLEELVGEIADESDIEEHVIKRIDKLTIVAHGEAELKDINRFFNVNIAAAPRKSLAWIILKELGSIPQAGQQIKLGANVTATVEEMIGLHIQKVRLTKLVDEPSV